MKCTAALLLTLPLLTWSCGSEHDQAHAGTRTEATIAGLLAGDARFATLHGLLEEAGLLDELDGDGPFTLFAPTETAFDSLGGDVANLEGEMLERTLKFHIVPRAVKASDLEAGGLETLAGAPLQVEQDDHDHLHVHHAHLEAQVEAANGVVHVIGTVFVPK